MSKFKNMLLAALGLLLLSNLLLLTQRNTAQAQSPGVNLAQLVAQVKALQSTVDSQATTISTLQAKTAPFSLSNDPNAGGINTLLTIKGVNVQIVDGLNSTNSTSGLGNLIIGYNASGNLRGDVRTGSHNLILGDESNYQSYGGLIAGQDNFIAGPYASVSGGQGNSVNGTCSSVSGGVGNSVNGSYASVSGGVANKASNTYSSVSGGAGNTASGYSASVSGGSDNNASNSYAWVSGGFRCA